MVWRDHFREDFEEFIVLNQAVLIHLLILLDEKLQIFQKSVLELDRLAHVLVTKHALTAVTEVRCAYVIPIMNGLALELDGQFHLGWTSGRNLQKNDPEGEDIGGGGCLQKLHVHIALLALDSGIIFLRKAFNLEQMRSHIGRQMIQLIRNGDLVSLLNFNDVTEVDELDSFDLLIVSAHFDNHVFCSQIAVHGS